MVVRLNLFFTEPQKVPESVFCTLILTILHSVLLVNFKNNSIVFNISFYEIGKYLNITKIIFVSINRPMVAFSC